MEECFPQFSVFLFETIEAFFPGPTLTEFLSFGFVVNDFFFENDGLDR